MSQPIIRTEKQSGERTEVATLDALSEITAHIINWIVYERVPFETPDAIYTLNAEWLMETHDEQELASERSQ